VRACACMPSRRSVTISRAMDALQGFCNDVAISFSSSFSSLAGFRDFLGLLGLR